MPHSTDSEGVYADTFLCPELPFFTDQRSLAMATTDRGASNKSESERPPSTDEASADSRVVTDTEREDLIEDAEAFRASHERTFQLLSGGDN